MMYLFPVVQFNIEDMHVRDFVVLLLWNLALATTSSYDRLSIIYRIGNIVLYAIKIITHFTFKIKTPDNNFEILALEKPYKLNTKINYQIPFIRPEGLYYF